MPNPSTSDARAGRETPAIRKCAACGRLTAPAENSCAYCKAPLSPPDDGGGDEKFAVYFDHVEKILIAVGVENKNLREENAALAQRVKTLEEALRLITDSATTADGARAVARRTLAEPTP